MEGLEFQPQGSALVCDNHLLNHSYEIQETNHGTFLLRVDGEGIHFFDNQEYARKVAGLIEEDSWN